MARFSNRTHRRSLVMNQDSNGPQDKPAVDELEGSLRLAVAAIREQPVPQESMNLSLVLARRMETSRGARWQRLNKRFAIVGGIAAAWLVWTVFWADEGTKGHFITRESEASFKDMLVAVHETQVENEGIGIDPEAGHAL